MWFEIFFPTVGMTEVSLLLRQNDNAVPVNSYHHTAWGKGVIHLLSNTVLCQVSFIRHVYTDTWCLIFGGKKKHFFEKVGGPLFAAVEKKVAYASSQISWVGIRPSSPLARLESHVNCTVGSVCKKPFLSLREPMHSRKWHALDTNTGPVSSHGALKAQRQGALLPTPPAASQVTGSGTQLGRLCSGRGRGFRGIGKPQGVSKSPCLLSACRHERPEKH